HFSSPVSTDQAIGEYLAAHHSGRDVLIDGRPGYRVIYFAGSAAWFYTPGGSAFRAVARQPRRYLRYVLVSHLGHEGPPDRLASLYPGLYEHGASWATLERQWPAGAGTGTGWRLYRVKPL
ncbi:MAG: hypothetical protein ACYDAG_08415, partial [Chloroflexota bacterium]